MIDRNEALSIVKKHVKNRNLVKHMLAVETVMRALARKLNEDEEIWGIAGLLHDVDYDLTYDKPEKHSIVAIEILKDYDLPNEVFDAILAHSGKKERKTKIEKAIYAADPITGLIVAATLVHPTKKISSIDTRFVLNRFKEKSFARGANREQIKSITELGISLEEFVDLSLKAMQKISDELGL